MPNPKGNKSNLTPYVKGVGGQGAGMNRLSKTPGESAVVLATRVLTADADALRGLAKRNKRKPSDLIRAYILAGLMLDLHKEEEHEKENKANIKTS